MIEDIRDKFNRPLRDLRISVTDRCNFRCMYCMPNEIFGETYEFLPRSDLLTFEEISRLANLFASMGVVKIRITGGEPLLRTELEKLIGQLNRIEGINDIALTTNGYLLTKKSELLREAGLDRITVSLDSLDEEVFKKMNGREVSTEPILEAIEKAKKTGFHPIKINTVVKKGVNDHTILDLAKNFKGTGCIVRFIEYMDVGNRNGWKMDHVVPVDQMVKLINDEMPIEPVDPNYNGEVASRYRYQDGSGEIGFIASVTHPFCGGCTRLRLSAEGKLYTCLFASQGTNLRDPIRDGAGDDDLIDIILNTWNKRDDQYSELRTSVTKDQHKKVEMYHIGG